MLRCWIALLAALALSGQGLQVGVARRDITPGDPVPMWGYGARHDALSQGTLDPLHADALVVEAGGAKLAIVGLDLGRAPAEASLERIRKRIRDAAGIEHSVLAGSHTHHGPVLELSDQPGKGRGRFDTALRYYRQLEDRIVEAVVDADRALAPARIAAGSVQLDTFNRNRHTKREPKPVDRELAVLRLDGADGKPRAVLVNFAAHPTMLPAQTLKFSADFAGPLKAVIAKETGAAPLYLPGAAGDLSTNAAGRDYRQYGEALGHEAVKLASSLTASEVPEPTLVVREDRFSFASRTDFRNPLILAAFSEAFFPELIPNYVDEYAEGIRPRLTVAVLNGDIGLVAVSGEFFSSHALRLRERARLRQLFFIGYANGYHQYFPTIEAAAEGGYGADSRVSPAEVGAGEKIMNAALLWLYQLRGKLK